MSFSENNSTLIRDAVTATEKGDLKELDRLLGEGGDTLLLATDSYGYQNTLLHVAAQHGRLSCLQRLIRAGPPLNPINSHHRTPLLLSIISEHPDCALALLDAGARSDLGDDEANNALHAAAQMGMTQMIEPIIKSGAPLNLTNFYGRTALFLSILNHRYDCVELLIWRGADIHRRDNQQYTPLYVVPHLGSVDILDLLIKAGAKIDALNGRQQMTILHNCCGGSNGLIHSDLIQHLVRFGADVNTKDVLGHTPLYYFLWNTHDQGNIPALLSLLNAGAELDLQEPPLLHSIMKHGPIWDAYQRWVEQKILQNVAPNGRPAQTKRL